MGLKESAQRVFRQTDILPQGEARYWFDQMPHPIRLLWGKNAKDAQKILQKTANVADEKRQAVILLQMTRILTTNEILSPYRPETLSLRNYYADNLLDISKLEAKRILNGELDETYWQTTGDIATSLLKSQEISLLGSLKPPKARW